ncbi:MAG TPA: sulfatase-like hydrolase/transferase [Xanthobacteraceae bacterium]|nr:sulfatase-like hydrolase/transferase [Xanthobacteraceae bacterium]
MQRVAWVIAGSVATGVGVQVVRYEAGGLDIVFTLALIGTTCALVALVSRRPLFAVASVTTLVALILLVSKAKQEAMNMGLHAYDIIFYLGSWSTVRFLTESYRLHVIALGLGIAAVIVVSVAAYRIDSLRLRRPASAAIVLGFALVALAAGLVRDRRDTSDLFFGDSYVSLFFASLPEALPAIWSGNLMEAASETPDPNFTMPATCQPDAMPNIVLIHQESVVPPSYFPGLAYDRDVDSFFRSHDGKQHKLRVETFGGASWLTEFSVLTGLSSYSFGSMRSFVQVIMADKVHDALPQVLDRCGYYNLIVYPMLRNFASNARFYDSIGFHKFLDAKLQKATQAAERDRFYYTNALSEMERHFAGSAQPMFVYILTQATHGTYDFTYMPEVEVAGGGPGADPLAHEYLRRLGMAAIDYEYFKAELARRFPDRPFLIVNYGDHQPDIARRLLGHGEYRGALSIERHPEAFFTYYSVDAVGYRPPPQPALDYLDVPYLGTVLLNAARLPLPDSYRERARLMWLCSGRYHDCAHKAEILKFHRRLMNSGLIGPV